MTLGGNCQDFFTVIFPVCCHVSFVLIYYRKKTKQWDYGIPDSAFLLELTNRAGVGAEPSGGLVKAVECSELIRFAHGERET